MSLAGVQLKYSLTIFLMDRRIRGNSSIQLIVWRVVDWGGFNNLKLFNWPGRKANLNCFPQSVVITCIIPKVATQSFQTVLETLLPIGAGIPDTWIGN